MTQIEIVGTVRSMVARHLGLEPSQVTDTALLVQDLGADSLDTVELMMALEEKFDIEIPEGMAKAIRTVADAAQIVVAQTGAC